MERRNARRGRLARRVRYNTDVQHVPRVWFFTPGERRAGIVQPWHRSRGGHTFLRYQPWLERWWEKMSMQGREKEKKDPVCQMPWKCPSWPGGGGESKTLSVFWNAVVCGLCELLGIQQWSDPASPLPIPSPFSLSSLPNSPGFHHCPRLYGNERSKTQTTVSVQSPPDRSLAADQKHFQAKKTYI